MDFYRVFNWNPAATTPDRNGHPLYVWPDQGAGRVDDPYHDYLVLYVGSSPECAIAEALGRFRRWTPAVLAPPPGASPGVVKALAHYSGTPITLDLDDPTTLADLGLRPSQVIDRDRAATQQWARRIYDTHDHDGVSWWSFYGAQWSSFGLWDWSSLSEAEAPVPLALTDHAVRSAASMIARPIEP